MNATHVYAVFETDAWHSTRSKECKGVYTSKEDAVEAIANHHSIPLEEFDGLTEDEAKELLKKEFQLSYQTQGYSTNYMIETWILNTWN